MDFVPLCEPWPATLTCDLSAAPIAATGAALQAASEYYWAKSGNRFGSCEVLVRPCKATCPPSHGLPFWSGQAWPPWLGPTHGAFRTGFLCNQCRGNCSCNNDDEIILPAHAQSVTEVIVDGEPLPASGFALLEGNTSVTVGSGYRLLRVDGERWPDCQDWSIPVSGAGAWSVTAVFGFPVPQLGQLAVGELTCEITKAIEPGIGECRLPSGVVRIIRANVTQELLSLREVVQLDLAGLPLGERFLDTVNPHARNASGQPMGRLRLPAKIWNPDDF